MKRKLLLLVLAFVFGASMIAQETVPFVNAPSQAAVGTVTYNMPVTGGYTLGTIDWDGFASTINSGTYGSELTCDISGPLGSATVTLGSGTTYSPGASFPGSTAVFDMAGDPAGTWTFDFYETYDDGGDGLPDANWDFIDFDFNVYVPPTGVTAPWAEPFAATSLPAEWAMSGPENWLFSTGAGYGAAAAGDHTTGGGTQYAWVDGSGSGTSTGITLTTPVIDPTGLTIPEFTFWYFSNNTNSPGDNNTLYVEMSVDGGAYSNILTYAGDNANWLKFAYDLSGEGILTSVQFRFIVDEDATTAYWNDMLIDDVAVDEMPTTPVITVTPPSPHNFNFAQVGNTASQTFTVTNTGGGVGNITGASIAGDPEFSIASTTNIPGFLPPDLVEVVVDFAPTATGTFSATLTITDAGGTTDVLLSGEGVAPIANDDCADAIPVTGPFPQTVMGTTKGAEVDCPGDLDWGAVWYEVTLPYALNDLSASFCGTATPPMFTGGIVYLPDCASCGSYVIADYYGFDPCTAPDDNTLQMSWDDVPGPTTIMFPAYAADDAGNGVDFTLTLDVMDASVVVPGTNCTNPIVIPSLGYMTSDNTINYGNSYTSADDPCDGSSYLNGDDVVYSYTPAADECIDITLTNTGTWVGLFVYEGCAPFTTCVGFDTQSGGNPSLSSVSLTGGTEYFIIISTWPTPDNTAYDLEIDLCPSCPAPTNLTQSNLTAVGADLAWDYHIDSFFDVFYQLEGEPAPDGTTTPTAPNVHGNAYTIDDGTASTGYDWYVRANCDIAFTNPVVDYFWMAMDPGYAIIPALSGGLPVDDQGEDGVWWEYPNAPEPWWNIWFYNGPLDPTNMKLVRYGFWIQSLDGVNPGELFNVLNWSTDQWAGVGFPTPADEAFIERSPTNGPIIIDPATPQWIELTYLLEDYCPEWVSIDLWGQNIQILEVGVDPPPVDSPLFDFWIAGDPGGILVHECLPPPTGDNSDWSGPGNFTTLAPPPVNNDCSGAIPVFCGNVYSGSTDNATNSAIPDCQTFPNTAGDVWYHFAGTGQMVSADLCTNTTYDSRMSVFEGSCGALVCVDGNDDYCGTHSRVDWYAESGVDYYILVHGYNLSTGAFDLTIDCTNPATATWVGGDGSFLDPNPTEDWFGADNWDVQDVPGATTNVSIPGGLTDYPTIDRTAVSNDIVVGSSASGDASILGDDMLTVNGASSVERFITGGEWHDVSASTQAQTVNSIYLGGSPEVWLYEYLEPTNLRGPAIVDVNTPMPSGKGFEIWVEAGFNGTASFDGPFQTTDLVYTALSNSGPEPFGYNLVGNPFASPIDLDEGTWDTTNITSSFWVWDPSGPNYLAYNSALGSGTLPDGIIPLGQGFFIQTLPGGPASLTIPNDARVHSAVDFYKESREENNLPNMLLTAKMDTRTDALNIAFLDEAEDGFDKFDTRKFFSSEGSAPQVYTREFNEILTIDALPSLNNQPKSVLVGYVPGSNGIQTFIADLDDLPETDVLLEDLFIGYMHNLNETPVYEFDAEVGDDPDRFILHFNPMSVGIEDPENEGLISIYAFDDKLFIKSSGETAKEDKQVWVYDMMGRTIIRTTANASTLTTIPTDYMNGYVIVRVVSESEVKTTKVYIK